MAAQETSLQHSIAQTFRMNGINFSSVQFNSIQTLKKNSFHRFLVKKVTYDNSPSTPTYSHFYNSVVMKTGNGLYMFYETDVAENDLLDTVSQRRFVDTFAFLVAREWNLLRR
jgi:hypothetical protein